MAEKEILTEQDKIFIAQHKFMSGEENAKKMLEDVKKSHLDEEKRAKKVFINVYGAEVHVNGPIIASVNKPETLRQKIARFDRLAENVRANRALLNELAQSGLFDDETETDEESDKEIESVVDVDDFGDVQVKSQTHMNFKEKESTGSAGDTDDVGDPQSIAADEAAPVAAPSAADPAKPSDIAEQ